MSDIPSGRPRTEANGAAPAPVFLAQAPAMLRVAEALERAAATDVRVVLYGEPGVGKSLAARRIHALSARRTGPFARLSVRDGRAVERLSEGEFLRGLEGGTLVLEGIDEAPPEVQAVLVGVVEEWAGAEEAGERFVRVVSTGERDLLGQVERGAFRRDLYYMIDVFPLLLPPLRERAEEIPLFLDHFFRRHAPDQEAPPVPRSFLDEAFAYGWPGNLRELENLVVASLPAGGGRQWRFPKTLPRWGGEPRVLSFAEAKREFERAYVRRLLLLTGGNVTRAAGLAGKARKDFYALMARNEVDPAEFRHGVKG
ncbi:MAG: hypothetical protein Kow0092_14530 [Deferrisomatales bacterium]